VEVVQLKIIRTVFQDTESRLNPGEYSPKCILVLDMEGHYEHSTKDIPGLSNMLEQALPGIFPSADSPIDHSCGGLDSGIEKHSFKEEIENGTNIPHLLEHVLIYLLGRRMNQCAAYCGQRSIDIEQGINTHYYLVMDYPSKLEAIIAIDLAFQLISSWIDGKAVTIDQTAVFENILQMIEPMLKYAA